MREILLYFLPNGADRRFYGGLISALRRGNRLRTKQIVWCGQRRRSRLLSCWDRECSFDGVVSTSEWTVVCPCCLRESFICFNNFL